MQTYLILYAYVMLPFLGARGSNYFWQATYSLIKKKFAHFIEQHSNTMVFYNLLDHKAHVQGLISSYLF